LQVARDLGVSHCTLRGWCKRSHVPKRQKKALPAALKPTAGENAERKLKGLERKNERLKRENETLRMDRETLKKSSGFSAKESERSSVHPRGEGQLRRSA
jgi:hypothetical protein